MEKSIREFVTESLSSENEIKLKNIIDRLKSIDNDSDFSKVYNRLSGTMSTMGGIDPTGSDSIDPKILESYLKSHGLDNVDFGRNRTPSDVMIDIFGGNGNLNILKGIIGNGKENDGVISVGELATQNSNNIFDIAKRCRFGDWSDEAITLARMTNPKGSAAVGMFEILLQFMLKGGYNPDKGDVGVKEVDDATGTLGDGKTMEIKAISKSVGKNGKPSTSGGHVAGQSGNIGQAKTIYQYIDINAFGIKKSSGSGREYLQNQEGFNNMLSLFDQSGMDETDFLAIVFDAIVHQYGLENKISSFKDLRNQFVEYIRSYGIDSMEVFFDAVGAVQLYLYFIIEKFDYILCVYIDKREVDDESGNFLLLTRNDLNKYSIEDTLKNLSFGKLDSETSTQGRTGKMYFRFLK